MVIYLLQEADAKQEDIFTLESLIMSSGKQNRKNVSYVKLFSN